MLETITLNINFLFYLISGIVIGGSGLLSIGNTISLCCCTRYRLDRLEDRLRELEEGRLEHPQLRNPIQSQKPIFKPIVLAPKLAENTINPSQSLPSYLGVPPTSTQMASLVALPPSTALSPSAYQDGIKGIV